jgi:hypothetical protein
MAENEQQLLARWTGSIRDPGCSPMAFYELVEAELGRSVAYDVALSLVTRREGGLFTANRVYLRIAYERLFFDLSAIVSGGGMIVSYWLHASPPDLVDLVAEIPGIGFIIERTSRAVTYYSVDQIEHFQRSVHAAVLFVVDALADRVGQTPLPADARAPIWEEIW